MLSGAVPPAPKSISAAKAALPVQPAQAPRATLISSQQKAFPARIASAPKLQAARAAIGRADPRGVDLNLSQFDLSTATRVSNQASTIQLGENACAAIGKEF